MRKNTKEEISNQEIWELEVECEGAAGNEKTCGHIWKVKAEDIGTGTISFMGDVFEVYGGICPRCGTFTGICSWRIPKEVREKIKS